MKRIAITGPECSGKSTLTDALAKHYKVVPAEEYAVEFLSSTNGHYEIEDLDVIAEGQLRAIETVSKQDHVIVDTEMLVMKIWSEFQFGELSQFIKEAWLDQQFDVYFLCAPDIPYEDAEFRENPGDREELFDLYLKRLAEDRKNYIVLKGSVEERLRKAIEVIDAL